MLAESVEKGYHRGNLRLLQHHLTDPDAIGIAVAPPGKVALVSSEPAQQTLRQT